MTSETFERLLFVDVETTGLTHRDRVITIGFVALDFVNAQPTATCGHYIFNPGQPSNPFAAAVHGYDEWTLRHQPDFHLHAGEIHPHFAGAQRIIAHNASFDERFIRTEFAASGFNLPAARFFCTMQAWRARFGSPAGLDPVINRLGIKSRGRQHGALEDAWLCMRVYLWLHGLECPAAPDDLNCPPVNWIRPEPKPIWGARAIRRNYL